MNDSINRTKKNRIKRDRLYEELDTIKEWHCSHRQKSFSNGNLYVKANIITSFDGELSVYIADGLFKTVYWTKGTLEDRAGKNWAPIQNPTRLLEFRETLNNLHVSAWPPNSNPAFGFDGFQITLEILWDKEKILDSYGWSSSPPDWKNGISTATAALFNALGKLTGDTDISLGISVLVNAVNRSSKVE